jgi:hypothetical protein
LSGEQTFRISQAFPADKEVARYVVVLGWIYNDWRRTMDAMLAAVDQPDGMGIKLLRFRQVVGYSHEATLFLEDARERYPKIDEFVLGLGADVLREYDRIFDTLRPVKKWVREQRNATFHYPRVKPWRKGETPDFEGRFANALAAAADAGDVSSATLATTYGGVRFDFADAVLAHRLGIKLPEQEDQFKALIDALIDSQNAVKVFVAAAVSTYLESLPPGIVERTEDD